MQNVKPFTVSGFFFALVCERIFIQHIALKVDVIRLENVLLMV